MSRVRFRSRWLAGSLAVAGCTLAGAGCAETAAERNPVPPTVRLVKLPPADANARNADALTLVPIQPACPHPPAGEVVPVAYQPAQPEKGPQLPLPEPGKPTQLPPPEKINQLPTPQPEKGAQLSAPHPMAAQEKVVPINLDTVFRLAEEQNAQVAVAREKLNESERQQSIAAKAWLPKVYAGMAYYRHEGGIQNEDGTLTHSSSGALLFGLDLHSELDLRELTYQRVSAERNTWQQRGEVSRVTSETLMEAVTTYLDLLAARRGEAVVRELEKYLIDAQERAEKLAMPEDRAARMLVEAARAEVSGRRQAIAKLRQQGDAASAKLAYLLGMGPHVKLVPVEETLTPIDLIDPTTPTAELVDRVLANGPGVRELEGMLSVMQEGFDKMTGPGRFLPTVLVDMGEGGFWAGPGGELSPDNRWDWCVRVRWNLTEFATAKEKRHVAESRIEQARLIYEDLRGKLTSGVQEARDASLSGREQIGHSTEQIKFAGKSYELSDYLLKMKAPNASVSDTLQAIRGLEAAHFNYVNAVNAYNKAQVRLLVLLGPTAANGGHCDVPSKGHGTVYPGLAPKLAGVGLKPEF
jgi:outer membrane protein TolC